VFSSHDDNRCTNGEDDGSDTSVVKKDEQVGVTVLETCGHTLITLKHHSYQGMAVDENKDPTVMFDDSDMTDNLKTGNNNVSTKDGGV